MSDTTSQITALADFVEFACRATSSVGRDLWWRGHADASWQLLPGAFRPSVVKDRERNLCIRFVSQAKARRPDLQSLSDSAQWLFLMQHHRLPTRLLDWSESPLVALYFACCELPSVDARVYLLDPVRLNHAVTGRSTLPVYGYPTVREMVSGAFGKFAQEPERILAVAPSQSDLRMMIQHAAFTIHSPGARLEPLAKDKDWLQYLDVPAAAKAMLVEHLRLMGVRRSLLFPDLDSLSVDLAGLTFSDLPTEEPPPGAA